MAVSINISGDQLDPKKEQEKLEQEMLDYAKREAERLAPVDTGRLRADIKVGDDGLYNTVEYAPYVHDGTIDQMPRPYLRDALIRALRRAEADRL